MRKTIYRVMVSLPARFVSGGTTLLGLFGTFATEDARKVVGDRMTAENIQYIGMLLLAATLLYFFLLWRLKPGSDEGGGTTQSPTSHGAYSPATAVAGDFNYYAAPPPLAGIQGQGTSRETDSPKGYNIGNAARLSQVISGQRDSDYKRDMALVDVGEYVASVKGYNHIRQVELEIADMVHERQMHVWARRSNNPIEMLSTHVFPTLQVELKHDRMTTLGLHAVHRTPWYDVQFSREEVERIWPKT
jgi:hypothetical protein